MKEIDSEDDEGFIPAIVQIKSENRQKFSGDEKFERRPVDFQSRFILGDGILKYELEDIQEIAN